MTNKAEFEAANAKYATAYQEAGDGKKAEALGPPPAKHALILTCMDARVIPEKLLGLDMGDCHILRNGGGRVTPDVLRSLACSQRLLGTEEIYLIHHTDCGLSKFTNDILRHKIKVELGDKAASEADQMDFLPFLSPENSLKDDVAALKASALVPPEVPIFSYVYDVATGQLKEIS